MLDIGLGEVLLIAVLALLVFGPDRLPKVAADAARTLRQIRQMASAARRELSDAAGLQDDDLTDAVRDLRDLDPRRALLGTDPARPGAGSAVGAAAGPAGPVGPTTAGIAGVGDPPRTAAAPDATTRAAAVPGATSGGAPQARPVVEPADADPDWT